MNLIKEKLDENKKAGLKFNYRIKGSNIYLKDYEDQTDLIIQIKEDVRQLSKELNISLKFEITDLETRTLKKLNKFGGWSYVCSFHLEGAC